MLYPKDSALNVLFADKQTQEATVMNTLQMYDITPKKFSKRICLGTLTKTEERYTQASTAVFAGSYNCIVTRQDLSADIEEVDLRILPNSGPDGPMQIGVDQNGDVTFKIDFLDQTEPPLKSRVFSEDIHSEKGIVTVHNTTPLLWANNFSGFWQINHNGNLYICTANSGWGFITIPGVEIPIPQVIGTGKLLFSSCPTLFNKK